MNKAILRMGVLSLMIFITGNAKAQTVLTGCKVISIDDGFYNATSGGGPASNPFLYIDTDKGGFVYFPFEHTSEALFDKNEMLKSFKATALSAMAVGKRINVYYVLNNSDGCWNLPGYSCPCKRVQRIVLTSTPE